MSSILWTVLGIAAMLLDSSGPAIGHDRSQLALSVLMIAFGAWAFWHHGRAQVTAAGIYCLSAAIFVGFAGLWWWSRTTPVDDPTYVGTATGYWTTLGMYATFWARQPSMPRWRRAEPGVTAWGMRIGVVATVLAMVLGTAGLGSLGEFTIGGLALFLVSAMLHRAAGGRLPVRLALVLLAIGVYWQVAFDGFGRLSVASLAFVGAVVGSGLVARRTVKAAALVTIVPAVMFLVSVRNQIGAGTGIGSVVNPVRDFGRLVSAHGVGRYDYADGDTFIATFLFWVPRSVWESKPDGFGRELVALLEPQLLGTNHSMAALSFGEWFLNFGWLGVVVMVGVLGCAIRLLDRWLLQTKARDLVTRRQLLGAVLSVLLVANVANLMWGGSFTYFARTGQQIFLVLAVAIWTATVKRSWLGDLPEAQHRPGKHIHIRRFGRGSRASSVHTGR